VDQHTIAIFVAVALGLVVLYFLVMRVFFRDSKALDKKIDYTKMKKWKDEDE
jgi:low affinity Fe/Cu permease